MFTIARVFRHLITFHVFCKIFKKYYKSEIWQNFSYQTQTLYFFHISFTLENDNTVLWWIYSKSTLSVGKTGDSCNYSVYTFYTGIRIWKYIFSVSFRFPFRSVFHSVPFSVPRFSNTPFSMTITYICINDQVSRSSFSWAQNFNILYLKYYYLQKTTYDNIKNG